MCSLDHFREYFSLATQGCVRNVTTFHSQICPNPIECPLFDSAHLVECSYPYIEPLNACFYTIFRDFLVRNLVTMDYIRDGNINRT